MDILFPSFFSFFWAVIIFSIPIGYIWIWVYTRRRKLKLPDWLSGILAAGIIRGHKIKEGNGSIEDAMFIIIATIVTTYLTLIIFRLLCSVLST